MKRLLTVLGLGGILLTGAASTVQCPFAGRQVVTVEVVNDTPVAIQATFEHSSDPNISEDQLLATGTVSSLNVGSGDPPQSFDLSCSDAQALILDRADLLVTGGGAIGTHILYQGLDYFCGEVVSFDFTASQDLTTLDVTVTYRNQ